MKIEQGTLAYTVLMNKDFQKDAAKIMTPEIDLEKATEEEIQSHLGTYRTTSAVFSADGSKNYYITNTVVENLELLKVGTNKDLDWSIIINAMTNPKCTYILPEGVVIRVYKYHPTRLAFVVFYKEGQGIYWSSGFVNTENNTVSGNWKSDEKLLQYEMLTYKIMCFLYLTENEEQIVPANSKAGTRKSGKVINRTNVPLIVVTSKWNITSIRTEGFNVSGHFRLQPTKEGYKLIYIEPFQKQGYIRKAKKEFDS
jgi:hypothetical protein